MLERTGRRAEAYDAYGKAAWSAAWRSPAWLAMARLDAARGDHAAALARARDVIAVDHGQLQARAVAVLVLRRTGRAAEAEELLRATTAIDPLDWWARDLGGDPVDTDAPTCLDIALEYASVGELDDALQLLERAAGLPTAVGQVNVAPLALYHRADLLRRAGRAAEAEQAHAAARSADLTYCLASRPDDADMLRRTCAARPDDSRAWALLGHWLYAEHRHDDAVDAWRRSVDLDGGDAVVHRNLAVAMVNVLGRPDEALHWYERALEVSPDDPRLVYESDELAKRAGAAPQERLDRLTSLRHVVEQRDDLTITCVELLTALERADEALEVLRRRRFQPWEGGEGRVLGAWDEALLALARRALADADPQHAIALLEEAFAPPANLGEGRHPLANCSHLWLTLGDARHAAGDPDGAREGWRRAARFAGDFRTMSAVPYSEMTYYSVLAARRLRDTVTEAGLVDGLAAYSRALQDEPATVDYFATSLPTMLLFTEDVQATADTTVLLIQAQLALLAGERDRAAGLVARVLDRDPVRVRALDVRRELAAAPAGPSATR